jgi:hypothetical protein
MSSCCGVKSGSILRFLPQCRDKIQAGAGSGHPPARYRVHIMPDGIAIGAPFRVQQPGEPQWESS